MKLKQSILIMMAAAMPFTALAANDVIPVVKAGEAATTVTNETVTTSAKSATTAVASAATEAVSETSEVKTVRGAKKAAKKDAAIASDVESDIEAFTVDGNRAQRNSITYRVSSTATPEQNKHLRSEVNSSDRKTVEVVAPDASRYMDRKQVAVAPVEFFTDHLDFVFPSVKSVSPVVEKSINTTIKKYVSKVQNDTQKINETEANKQNVIMYYDVKADDNGIFSVLIHTYTIGDHDANGVNYVKGFTFNTTTGRQLSLYDMGGLNKDQLITAINNNPSVKTAFPGDVTFDKMPKEFYTTDDYSVVMILQQDVDTIHSAGTVYVPVGDLRDKVKDTKKKKK